jgi:curved DNA-binding protein CbpA
MRSSFPDHYGTLGVQQAATQREISGAYRKFMRTHHPDIDAATTDRSQLLRIMEAFAVLRNPVTRAAYDKELARRQAPVPRNRRRNPNPPPRPGASPRMFPSAWCGAAQDRSSALPRSDGKAGHGPEARSDG